MEDRVVVVALASERNERGRRLGGESEVEVDREVAAVRVERELPGLRGIERARLEASVSARSRASGAATSSHPEPPWSSSRSSSPLRHRRRPRNRRRGARSGTRAGRRASRAILSATVERVRCEWTAGGDELMLAYHDEEWGVPSHDDRHLFELLTLEGAQAGLSWATILRKREGYREAFAGFDRGGRRALHGGRRRAAAPGPGHRAQPAEGGVDGLERARACSSVQEELGEPRRVPVELRRRRADRRAAGGRSRSSPRRRDLSRALSKDLKRRGFRFVGPTICYAFMQSVGMVNDHVVGCFRFDGARRMSAPIRYARSGDVNIAYQVTGDGPFDLVLVPGFFSHLEIDWEHPAIAHVLERLGSFSRLIRFDKRGTGLSDRTVGLPDFETRMDDVRAVMDAVGSEQAALFGYSEGGPMSRALRRDLSRAHTGARPLRDATRSAATRTTTTPGRRPWDERLAYAQRARGDVGRERRRLDACRRTLTPALQRLVRAPRASVAEPGGRARPHPHELAGRRPRRAPGASSAQRSSSTARATSTRRSTRAGTSPTRIPGARFVELPGDDHVPVGRPGPDRRRGRGVPHRSAPPAVVRPRPRDVLFTDLVGSTERAAALGDAAWGASRSPRHDDAVRRRARAVLRRGDRHGRRRVPRPLRRAGARDPLRARDPGRARRARARGASGRAHRRGRAAGAGTSRAGSRCTSARVSCRSRGGRRGAGQLDDARSRRRLRARVRGPRRARAEGDRRSAGVYAVV